MDASEAKKDRKKEINDWARVTNDTRRKKAEKEEERAKLEAKKRLEKVREQDGERVSAERLGFWKTRYLRCLSVWMLFAVGLRSWKDRNKGTVHKGARPGSLEGKWAFDSEARRRLKWSLAKSGEIAHGASESQSTYSMYIHMRITLEEVPHPSSCVHE